MRLGLGRDADAKAIRLAYAREVKLIDQQHQAAEFQILRGAYEYALDWAAYQADEPAPDEAETAWAPPPPAPPEKIVRFAAPVYSGPLETADPQMLAHAAIVKFSSAFAVLAKGRSRAPSLWQGELRRRLDGDDLLNIAARRLFEEHIARMLADGWRPGHESLFAAATIVFDWGNDGRGLQQFGFVGKILDRAIEEQSMFDNQLDDEKRWQRKIVDQLREKTPPIDEQFKHAIAGAEQLVRRFPNLMAVTTNVEQIAHWKQLRDVHCPFSFRGDTRSQVPQLSYSSGWAQPAPKFNDSGVDNPAPPGIQNFGNDKAEAKLPEKRELRLKLFSLDLPYSKKPAPKSRTRSEAPLPNFDIDNGSGPSARGILIAILVALYVAQMIFR